MNCFRVHRLFRTKSPDVVTSETCLKRCLGMLDLTVLGVGSMIGSGIYIMTGITAKEQSGPSIALSFLLASLIVLLFAACYTELAARLHKTGSTYLYLYLTVGELPAFIVGFSILVLGVFSGATNARACSAYIDLLFNSAVSNFTQSHITQWNVGPPIASYPDVMAVILVVLLTLVVALGVQCSAKVLAFFVVINVTVLTFITICGFVYGNFENWMLNVSDDNSTTVGTSNATNTASFGTGGFLPYGWRGMIRGAATCFWAFSGFEMISCAVEESRNPRRDIPIATSLTMLIVTILYLGVSAGITLMVPYMLIDTNASLPAAFSYHNVVWGRYIVVIGPLCGFTSALLSGFYGFARTALAMAEDGLLFSWFGQVNSYSHVPVLSVLFCGLLQAVIALAFDIRDLIEFSVNLLFLSYCASCSCVIVLRYKQQQQQVCEDTFQADSCVVVNEVVGSLTEQPVVDLELELCRDDSTSLVSGKNLVSVDTNLLHSWCKCLEPLIVCNNGRCVTAALLMMMLCMLGLAFTLVYEWVPLETGVWWSIAVVTLAALGICIFLCLICIHRQTLHETALKLPCVPLVPSVGILLSLILLVFNSSRVGWIGSAILLLIALVHYVIYGIHHSKLNAKSYFELTTNKEMNTAKERLLSDSETDEMSDEMSGL